MPRRDPAQGALKAEWIAGVGVAIEAKLFQRGQYQAPILVLEREALQGTRFDRQSYKLGDAALEDEATARLIDPRDA